jgi:hypothetical protein
MSRQLADTIHLCCARQHPAIAAVKFAAAAAPGAMMLEEGVLVVDTTTNS